MDLAWMASAGFMPDWPARRLPFERAWRSPNRLGS
jgi:hypothetical protein